ncbi:ferric-chelate reductase Frp1 [Exophiala xenobiotica]|nr:ferric-chelate reductase Frp1 [Exophiala xenobiotica]
MRDIVQRWKDGVAGGSAIVTKRIRFVWVVKARDRVTWFQNQLETALADVEAIRRHEGHSDKELDLSIYVTCDEELEASNIATGCEPAAHGTAEIATTKTNELDNEKKRTDEKVDVINTVDEDGSPKACCCCAPSSSSASSLSVVEKGNVEPTAVMPRLKIVAGRPKPRSIIRKVLEEADGESAVVVCGPQGLQDDVRRSVVALSDERAVHKGTGAQGIYLHVEGFCY